MRSGIRLHGRATEPLYAAFAAAGIDRAGDEPRIIAVDARASADWLRTRAGELAALPVPRGATLVLVAGEPDNFALLTGCGLVARAHAIVVHSEAAVAAYRVWHPGARYVLASVADADVVAALLSAVAAVETERTSRRCC